MLPEDLALLDEWANSDETIQKIKSRAIAPVGIPEANYGQETFGQKARRLGVAALAHGIVEPTAAMLDIPGALGLPGAAEPGIFSRQAHEWGQGLGLRGTAGEAAAGIAGGLLGYLIPYAGTAKALEAGGALLGAGRAGQTLGKTTPVISRLAQGYEAVHPVAQVGAREAARGAGVWALTEAARPEELRTPFGEFVGFSAAGGVGFNLLGKLIRRVRGGSVPHEEGSPGTQAREGKLSAAVAGITEGTPAPKPSVDDEVMAAAQTLARMRMARGETDTQVQEALTTGLTREFGTSEADAVSAAANILRSLRSTAQPTAPTARVVATGQVTPATADLVTKAEALQKYWNNKVGIYRKTQQGLVTKAGESKTYKNVNEDRAARNADIFGKIVVALQEGRATDKQLEVLNKAWATRTKTKASRNEMAELGYVFPEAEARGKTAIAKTGEKVAKAPAKPPVNAGDTVYYSGVPFTVADASDPALLRLRAATGNEFNMPRDMVEIRTEAPVAPMEVQIGAAIWRTKAGDQPIEITGDMGIGPDGRRYVSVKGSQTSVPLDEVVYSPQPTRVAETPGLAEHRAPLEESKAQRPATPAVKAETQPTVVEEATPKTEPEFRGAGTLTDELEGIAEDIRNKADDIEDLKAELTDAEPEDRADIRVSLKEEVAELKQMVSDARATLKELVLSDDTGLAERAKSALTALRGKVSPQRVGEVLDGVLGEPVKVPSPPVWEDVTPGTEAWKRVVRENPALRGELQEKETEFWNGVATQLAPGGEKVVYVDAIRELPEVAEQGVPLSEVSKQLRKRGVEVGDPVDRVLDSLGVTKGSTVTAEQLLGTPEVKDGRIALNVLRKEAERRGATIVDEGNIIELHSGLPLPVLFRRNKVRSASNTKRTFTPIQDVSATQGSLPEHIMEKLPDDIRRGVEKLDKQIALVNSKIKEAKMVYGSPAAMEAGIREKFDKMVVALDKLAEKREKWREAVEIEIGDIRKRKYSKSLLNRVVKAKPIDNTIPIYDADGNAMGSFWVSPLKGKRLFIPKAPEVTKLDESIWRSQPSLYAHYFGTMRDLLGDAAVTPLRNAFRVTQNFEKEYQDWLYKIVKPIIKDSEALERVTSLLEGKKVRDATDTERTVAGELRKWYTHLFNAFGLNARRFLEDYAPRIRQAGSIRDVYGTKPPKELVFFAELERTAKAPVFPREMNALTTAMAYLRLGARRKFIQPALDEVAQYTNRLIISKDGTPRLLKSEKAGRALMHDDRKKILDELTNNLLRRPIWEERLLQGMVESVASTLGKELGRESRQVGQQLSAFTTHLIYLSTIGFNPMTVFKNITQQVLSIGTLTGNPATGLRYWAEAMSKLFTKPGRELLKYCWVLQDRVYLESLEQQTKILAGVRRPVEKAAFWAFEQSDKANVSISYMMKLLHALNKGKPLAEAVEAANTFAADTQFLYGLDSPLWYKSPIGRVIGVLSSYPVNFMRLLYRQGLFSAKTASTIGLLYGTVYGLSKLTGLDFSSETPLGTAEGWLPVSFVLSGDTGSSIPLKNVRNATKLLTAKLSDMPLETEAAWKDFKQSLLTLVPAHTQLARVFRTIDAYRSGGVVRDDEGKLKYRMKPGEAVRGLFGPTVESRERRLEHEEVQRAKEKSTYLRKQATQAYLRGDRTTFAKLQRELISAGYTPIRGQDIKQALQYQRMSALERHRKGLPKTYQGQ